MLADYPTSYGGYQKGLEVCKLEKNQDNPEEGCAQSYQCGEFYKHCPPDERRPNSRRPIS